MMEIQGELEPKTALIGGSDAIRRDSSPTINGQQTIGPLMSDENVDDENGDPIEGSLMDRQSIVVKEPQASVCAGCSQTIRDKFIFSVIDLHWHQDCVQCCDCSLKLTERCFTYNGKLYCKHHYWHRFGPKCYACNESINKSELVQRIKGNRVYHLKCFTCNQCNRRLEQGEQLHLIEDRRLLCKRDFQQLAASATNLQQMQQNGNSKSSNQQTKRAAAAAALASATDNDNKFQAIIHSNNGNGNGNANSGNNGFSKREHPPASEQQPQQQFNCTNATTPKAAALTTTTGSPYLTLLSPSSNRQLLDHHQLRASGTPTAKSKRTSLTTLDNTMVARRQINDDDDDDDDDDDGDGDGDGDDHDNDDDDDDDGDGGDGGVDQDIGLDDEDDERADSDAADGVYRQLDELDDNDDRADDDEDDDAIDNKSLRRRRRRKRMDSSSLFDCGDDELASASAANNLDTENVENRTAASAGLAPTGPNNKAGPGKLAKSGSLKGPSGGAGSKRRRRRKRGQLFGATPDSCAKVKDEGGSIKTVGATTGKAGGGRNSGESILNGSGGGGGQTASILASVQQGAQSQQQLLKSNCSNSPNSSSSSNSSASSPTDSQTGSGGLVQRARGGQQQQLQQHNHQLSHRQSNHQNNHHSHHNHSHHHSQSTGAGGGGGGGGGHKPTRVRTVLNEKQLQTLRDCYSHNPRPDALMKEQLVNMTGLSPRVIRVWFQNKRCKDKKKSILYKQMQQHEKDGRHLAGLTHIRGVPMVASSPIQYHEEHSSGQAGVEPCSPSQQQPLSVQSPVATTLAACNQQQQQQSSPAMDIHAYQPPWKGLVDYAQQQQQQQQQSAAQQAPGGPNKASPNHHNQQQQQQPERLDASSPRYQQLIGQIHGYGSSQSEQLGLADSSHQVIELHPPPQPPLGSSSGNNNNNANQLAARPQYSPGAVVQHQQAAPLMSPQLYPHSHPQPGASLMHPPPPPPPQHLHHAHHLTVQQQQQQQQQASGPPPPPVGHHMHQFQQH